MADVRDLMSLGVLGSFVPRELVDAAITAAGVDAQRSGGKLPPWAVFYLTMAMALFPDDDYEELAYRMAPLVDWARADVRLPAAAASVTEARKRLGYEPLRRVFEQVAVPVADAATEWAFLGSWRLMAIDGFETEIPATEANLERFGCSGGGGARQGYAKARVVGVGECASRAVVAAAVGPVEGKGSGERTLAAKCWPALEEGMLLMADREFYSWDAWRQAADTGADLLWRIGSQLRLELVRWCADGSYVAVITKPGTSSARRRQVVAAARAAKKVDRDEGCGVRVIEYDVPDRDGDGTGELITLITTIMDPRRARADVLAEAYHQRWGLETAFDRLKTHLRPRDKHLRSESPDLVLAELYGMLLTGWALAKVTCDAATEMGTDPRRVKFKRAIRIVRRHATSEAAFPP